MTNRPSPSIPEPLVSLLRATIESEARLVVLLHLRRETPKALSVAAVGAALYMAPASAERDLARLCGCGFLAVTIGADLLYTYRPLQPELDEQVDEIARHWVERRHEVASILRGEQPARGPEALRTRPDRRKGNGEG